MAEPEQHQPIVPFLPAEFGERVLPDVRGDGRAMELTGDPSARLWVSRFAPSDTQAFVEQNLAGKVLVDLGCGSQYATLMAFTCSHGAVGYVGIDKFAEFPKTGRGQTEDGFPYALLKTDMLEYLSRLSPRLCNISLNAIDTNVIPESASHVRLAAEISRITQPGSMVFGAMSTAFAYFNQAAWADRCPNRLNLPFEERCYFCYERV